MTASKLIDDCLRPPQDPFVRMGVFDAPMVVNNSASYLIEAHRLVMEEMKNGKQQQEQDQDSSARPLQQSLRDGAAAAVQDFANLRTELRSLFGRAALQDNNTDNNNENNGGGADADAEHEDPSRKARRDCVSCEVFVDAYARLNAKERVANAVRRRRREGDDDSSAKSVLELSLDLPAGFLTHGLPAATQQEQREGAMSRRALLSAQTLRRDMQQHVVGNVLPAVSSQTAQLMEDLARIDELKEH